MFVLQTKFALDLLQQCYDIDKNKSIVISPISISSSLAMILLGAKNQTAFQIQNVIANGIDDYDKIHEHFFNILSTANNNDNELSIVNMAYFASNFALLDSFKQKMNKYYNGKFELINFVENIKAAKEINSYVSNATAQTIQNLVEPRMFNETTKLVVINAINLNKNWLYPFSTISDMEFFSAPNITIKVEMLTKSHNFQYLLLPDCEIIKLPYSDKNFSMIAILPIVKFGLNTLLKNLKIDQILNQILKASKEMVHVTIPKFKIESSFELPKILKEEFGIIDAFDARKADLSEISETPLFVSNIIHKAVIEVTRTGTKAASSTCSEMQLGSAEIFKKEYFFTANHPFLFLIIDQSKNIYFMGIFNK